MALYRGSVKVSGIGKVPGTTYLTQDEYDLLPASKCCDNVNYGIYESSEDKTVSKFIKNGVEYCLGGGGSCQVPSVDVLVVGGGGGGGSGTYGGGGGGGAVLDCCEYKVSNTSFCVIIGSGGSGNTNGGDTCFGNLKACGGGKGGGTLSNGGDGGNGGGSGGETNASNWCRGGVGYQGYQGGVGGHFTGGGGGGAGGQGGNSRVMCPQISCVTSGDGGQGHYNEIWSCCFYGAGGRGATNYKTGTVMPGGGGAYYGGGGNGGSGAGCQGIVILRYKTNGDCGINCATGGTITTDGDYTVHTFTSNDIFCITG